MNCPMCGASTNEYSIWLGASTNEYSIWLGDDTIQCTVCEVCFNSRTGEVLFKGTSLKMGSHLRELIREKKDGN